MENFHDYLKLEEPEMASHFDALLNTKGLELLNERAEAWARKKYGLRDANRLEFDGRSALQKEIEHAERFIKNISNPCLLTPKDLAMFHFDAQARWINEIRAARTQTATPVDRTGSTGANNAYGFDDSIKQ